MKWYEFISPKMFWHLGKEWYGLKNKKEELPSYIGVTLFVLVVQIFVYFIPTLFAWKIIASEPFFEYSNGAMKGNAIKLSRKGIIFDTWEGYMLNGSVSNGVASKWRYSVTDKEVVKCINDNEKVELTYKQYLLVPYSVGDSKHIVSHCKPL